MISCSFPTLRYWTGTLKRKLKKSVEMKEFTVFTYHKFALTKLRMCSVFIENASNVFFKSFTTRYILFILILLAVSGVVFVRDNTSELTIALHACISIIGVIQAIGMFYCYGINMTKIQSVHFKLQKIVDETVKGECKSSRTPLLVHMYQSFSPLF